MKKAHYSLMVSQCCGANLWAYEDDPEGSYHCDDCDALTHGVCDCCDFFKMNPLKLQETIYKLLLNASNRKDND